LRKSYPAYLWQVISEPGEAMFRLGEDRPVAMAALTAVLPGALMCVIGLVLSREEGPSQQVAVSAALRVLLPLVSWLLGSALCHVLARYVAGGEGDWQQMATVYGFSFAVRFFELLAHVGGQSGLLMNALYLWQAAVIVIGTKEVYNLNWGRSSASCVGAFIAVFTVHMFGPPYVMPLFVDLPVDAQGDPITKPLTTPNLLANPSFEFTDDSPLLTLNEIADWRGFCSKLTTEGAGESPSPARRVWELLPAEARASVTGVWDGAKLDMKCAAGAVEALNGVLRHKDLYQEKDFASVQLPEGGKRTLARGVKSLSDAEALGLNRMLLAASFPRMVAPMPRMPRGALKAWMPRIMGVPGMTFGQDTSTVRSGKASAFVRKEGLKWGQRSMFVQQLGAIPNKGAVQLSAWVKTDSVTRGMLYLYVMTDDRKVQQYNPELLTGTHDWHRCTVAATVPANAEVIAVAIGMWGRGTVWFDDLIVRTEFPPQPREPKADSKAK